MSDGNFADYITRERKRITGEQQNIRAQQQELQVKYDELAREMVAISAYETAKSGKPAKSTLGGNSGSGRARRGSKRDGIIEALQGIGEGLSRGELLEKLGLKGDKSGEMSVSNALTALTKAGAVIRNEAKKYVVG